MPFCSYPHPPNQLYIINRYRCRGSRLADEDEDDDDVRSAKVALCLSLVDG